MEELPKPVSQAWWPALDRGGCGPGHGCIAEGGDEKLDELRALGHWDGRRRPAHVSLPVTEDHHGAIGVPRGPEIRAVVAEVFDEHPTSRLSLRHRAQYGPAAAAALGELGDRRSRRLQTPYGCNSGRMGIRIGSTVVLLDPEGNEFCVCAVPNI